jgi:hypothetical protein
MPKDPKSDEFYTFEEVLNELKLSEDELKRMVSEGEIRAFKDEDRMKFKRIDVRSKKEEATTEPTVILPPGETGPAVSSTDATFIEEDTTSSIKAEEEIPIGSDTDIQIPGIIEEAEATTPIKPVSNIEETIAEDEIGVAETIPEESVETIGEEFVETVAEKTRLPKLKAKIRRFAAPVTAHPTTVRQKPLIYPESVSVIVPTPKFKIPPIYIALLGVILLFLTFVGSFIGDIIRVSSGKGRTPIGLTRELGQMVLDIVGIKDTPNLEKFKKEE